uniref:Putative vasotab tabanus bromius n=1 Tax=Lutzomyia longipalpis TaxID=7200 RepID=A0A1B0GIH7_LUTLO
MKFFAAFLICIFFISLEMNEIVAQCPRCATHYKPICAENEKTKERQNFQNDCFLLGQNCYSDDKYVKLHDGECDLDRYTAE